MKLSTTTRAVTVSAALATVLALSACGASNETTASNSSSGASSSAPQLSGTLNGAGSSAQQAAMQAWTAGYTTVQPGVTVNYDPVGSGGGRDQFLSGGVTFAGSDAALSDDEVTKAKTRCNGDVFELPDYISPIAVVYHLPGVDGLQLSPTVIAKIFSGQITTWNDPAIAADNPKATLPATKITPVHRSDKSGTTENFTDYLHAVAPDVWTNAKSGDWPLQGGEAGAQTAGLIAAVQAGEGAIGYADASQAGKLQVAKVGVGSTFVAPSAAAAAQVVANSTQVPGRSQYDYAIQLNRDTTASGEYPIVLVSYHIGCLKYQDAAQGKLLANFLSYVTSEAGQKAAAAAAGSAPINDQLRQNAQKAIAAIVG